VFAGETEEETDKTLSHLLRQGNGSILKGGVSMQVKDSHLAPPQLIEMLQHYVRDYSLDLKRVLCVDDYRYPAGVYSHDARTLVLNFATMPNERYRFGLFMLDLIPSLWAVQICVMLYNVRKAIQYKEGENERSKAWLEEDAMSWTYVEILRLVGLDKDLFMPDSLAEPDSDEAPMGIIGLRARNSLGHRWTKGGARVDLAGLQVKGAVELNRLRKFLKHGAIQWLNKKIKQGEIGTTKSFYTFLNFYEWMVYAYDQCNVQEYAERTRKTKMIDLGREELARFEGMKAERIKMAKASTDNLPAGG